MFRSAFVKQAAARAGFDVCGMAPSGKLDAERIFFERWLAAGMSGGLGYLHRNVEKRFAPGLLVENARSVIVCGVSYRNEVSAGYPEGWANPKVTSYALSCDYHETIKKMLRELAAGLAAEFGEFRFRVFCDSAPVLEKRWAVEAGLGWQGRNSIIVNPELGSYFFLGELITDMEADVYDEPYCGPGCGECRRCVQRCPNGAITQNRGIDVRKCVSRATIESYSDEDALGNAGETPLHGWIYGCDECQSVCPYNASAPQYRNESFSPIFDPRGLSREFWLSLSEAEFGEKFGNTSIFRTGLAQLRRNLEQKI